MVLDSLLLLLGDLDLFLDLSLVQDLLLNLSLLLDRLLNLSLVCNPPLSLKVVVLPPQSLHSLLSLTLPVSHFQLAGFNNIYYPTHHKGLTRDLNIIYSSLT